MAETMGDAEEGDFPCRVEGWLNVWEVEHRLAQDLFEHGKMVVPIWEPHFCVLQQDQRKLTHHRNEKNAIDHPNPKSLKTVRLDGGKQEFDKRWGYETLESIRENAIQHFPFASLDVFTRSQTLDNRSSSSSSNHSAYEKGLGERRGSVPVVGTSPRTDDNMEVPSTPSRLATFFSKRVKSNLKRTKSVTKLDRKRTIQNEVDGPQHSPRPTMASSLKRTMSLGRLAKKWTPRRPIDDEITPSQGGTNLHQHQALINSRMRTSRSHESLLMTHSGMHSIDLSAPDVEIKPLHSSILGQDHCFQVSTTNGSKYYSCRSAHERQKWIQCLRKTVMPNQEQSVRTENSLKLWVLEAKNCTAKKKYFCELCLDKTLYARTSSKVKNDMLFWGEQFDFNNLPPIETITVNLYKEADKKKKKEKNILLGYIHLPVTDVNARQLTERWYTASSAVVGKAGKENKSDLPLIRIKARYQTVTILPMDLYAPLINYIQTDYQMVVEVLEPLISVKAKEEMATSMVCVLQRLSGAKDFLSDIVMAEVDKIDNDNLTFRGNSIATKAMEAYMKLIGEKYLQDTLGDFIRTVLESSDDCEVDPARVANNLTLQRQQKNLIMYCEMVWFKIINSYCFFPTELRLVFASLAERCAERKRPEVSDQLVSACIFLRFLCPAILSPSLFNLTQEFPQERAARNLTLIAKTIQNLANFTKFGAKEEYMNFMNDFVEREFGSMQNFTHQISSIEGKTASEEFDGFIDLGKQLSVLHTVLAESLEKMNEGAEVKLGRLKRTVDELSSAQQDPDGTLRRLRSRSHGNHVDLYDNLTEDGAGGHHNHLNHHQGAPEPDANNTTNELLSTLMKDYNDADLSRSQDLPVLPAHSVPTPLLMSERRYQTLGVRSSHRPLAGNLRPGCDDYVLFSSLDGSSTPHGVGQVRTLPRTDRINADQVNQSWSKMLSAAELVNGGEYVDLISFMDENHEDVQNSSAELDNGSQVSIGQLSTVASSGYQSFGYSQSSSPVDCGGQVDVVPSTLQPLSFANPLFQHQNHCQTQTALPPGGRAGDLPRVMSSSSLSSDDGAVTCQSGQPATVCGPSQNGGVGGGRSHSNNTERALRHLSTMSCSSSSSESLGVSSAGGDQRTGVGVRTLPSPGPHPNPRRRRAPCSKLSHSHSLDSRCMTAFEISPTDHDETAPSPLRVGPLSKSAEFGQYKRATSTPHSQMKRPATDSVLSQQASSSLTNSPNCTYSNRRQSQNTVRMGLRSVQRHLSEQEKTKTDYEQELTLLRQQLADTQMMLQETQRRLCLQETSPDSMTTEWQQKLEASEERMRREQLDKDVQMKGIIQRLITVEEELLEEQKGLQSLVCQKQHVIEAQERRLAALDTANARLLGTLNQLKDRCTPPNGAVSNQPINKLTLTENGQFKSSSC